jgi:LysR family transcriptional activator of nhaA
LRYFHAIAHEGSLTKAASVLNLSQSALSVQLGKLEAQLGHPLFERQGKRLHLTEAGRIALDYADTVFDAGHELLGTLQGRPANRRILRVGAVMTLSRNFQMEFLRPLAGRADTELIIRLGSVRELLSMLESQAIDVMLANAAVRPEAQSPLHNHLLDEQPVSLVGRPRPGGAAFRFPDDLRTQPVLLPGPDSEMRSAFDRMLAAAGIRPVVAAEVDDMAMLRLLARESDAVTLVPPLVVRDELVSGALAELCRIPDVTERFYAIVQTRRFPNPLLDEVLQRKGDGV